MMNMNDLSFFQGKASPLGVKLSRGGVNFSIFSRNAKEIVLHLFENVEDWDEEAEMLPDIDRMWEVLHFVLTGIDSSEPIKGNPLSEADVDEIKW